MYGLKQETDLTFLATAELQQVCVGLYQVILNFSNDTTISIESEYEVDGKVWYAADGEQGTWQAGEPKKPAAVPEDHPVCGKEWQVSGHCRPASRACPRKPVSSSAARIEVALLNHDRCPTPLLR